MVEYYKTYSGYCYKIYKNGKKKRVSNIEFLQKGGIPKQSYKKLRIPPVHIPEGNGWRNRAPPGSPDYSKMSPPPGSPDYSKMSKAKAYPNPYYSKMSKAKAYLGPDPDYSKMSPPHDYSNPIGYKYTGQGQQYNVINKMLY